MFVKAKIVKQYDFMAMLKDLDKVRQINQLFYCNHNEKININKH